MKKTLAIIVSAALVTALSAGATLAYFTTTSPTANNIITLGKIDVSQVDSFPQNHSTGVVPNQQFCKTVKVTNNENSSYVVVKLVRHFQNKNSNDTGIASKIDFLTSNIWSLVPGTGSNWTLIHEIGDNTSNSITDYYLYGTKNTQHGVTTYSPIKLPKGVSTTNLIDGFVIDKSVDNTYATDTANIDVTTRAFQADNIDPSNFQSDLNGLVETWF